jgi:hypothetical protein
MQELHYLNYFIQLKTRDVWKKKSHKKNRQESLTV